MHVADGEDDDAGRDDADHEQHDRRQPVDVVPEPQDILTGREPPHRGGRAAGQRRGTDANGHEGADECDPRSGAPPEAHAYGERRSYDKRDKDN